MDFDSMKLLVFRLMPISMWMHRDKHFYFKFWFFPFVTQQLNRVGNTQIRMQIADKTLDGNRLTLKEEEGEGCFDSSRMYSSEQNIVPFVSINSTDNSKDANIER